jgi:hypothetical protein
MDAAKVGAAVLLQGLGTMATNARRAATNDAWHCNQPGSTMQLARICQTLIFVLLRQCFLNATMFFRNFLK